jgi:excinuclease ABC subunit A
VARKPALGLDRRVAAGTPEDIVKAKRSYTGQFLKPVLERGGPRGKKRVEAAE